MGRKWDLEVQFKEAGRKGKLMPEQPEQNADGATSEMSFWQVYTFFGFAFLFIAVVPKLLSLPFTPLDHWMQWLGGLAGATMGALSLSLLLSLILWLGFWLNRR